MPWGEVKVHPKVSCCHCSSPEENILVQLLLLHFQDEEEQRREAKCFQARQPPVSSRWQAAVTAKWPASGFSAM